jgi:Fe-S cluster assembly iron-binding protein IscA
MALDEPKDEDMRVESEGFEFLIEESLSDIYNSFSIDYSNNWLRKGFVVMPDRGGSSC